MTMMQLIGLGVVVALLVLCAVMYVRYNRVAHPGKNEELLEAAEQRAKDAANKVRERFD